MSTSFTRGENPLRADKLNTAFSERVSRSGDTMQGTLTLVGDPNAPLDAATKQYVDTHVTVAPLPIASTTVLGAVKVDGVTVQASPTGVITSMGGSGGGGISEAPVDGFAYGRQAVAWTRVIAASNDVVDGGNF